MTAAGELALLHVQVGEVQGRVHVAVLGLPDLHEHLLARAPLALLSQQAGQPVRRVHVEGVAAQHTAVVLASTLAPEHGRVGGALGLGHGAGDFEHQRVALLSGLGERCRVQQARLLLVQGAQRQLGVGVALQLPLLVILVLPSPAGLRLHRPAGREEGDLLVLPLRSLEVLALDQPVGEEGAALQVALLLREDGLEVLAGGGEGGVRLVEGAQAQMGVEVGGEALRQLEVGRGQLGQRGVGRRGLVQQRQVVARGHRGHAQLLQRRLSLLPVLRLPLPSLERLQGLEVPAARVLRQAELLAEHADVVQQLEGRLLAVVLAYEAHRVHVGVLARRLLALHLLAGSGVLAQQLHVAGAALHRAAQQLLRLLPGAQAKLDGAEEAEDVVVGGVEGVEVEEERPSGCVVPLVQQHLTVAQGDQRVRAEEGRRHGLFGERQLLLLLLLVLLHRLLVGGGGGCEVVLRVVGARQLEVQLTAQPVLTRVQRRQRAGAQRVHLCVLLLVEQVRRQVQQRQRVRRIQRVGLQQQRQRPLHGGRGGGRGGWGRSAGRCVHQPQAVEVRQLVEFDDRHCGQRLDAVGVEVQQTVEHLECGGGVLALVVAEGEAEHEGGIQLGVDGQRLLEEAGGLRVLRLVVQADGLADVGQRVALGAVVGDGLVELHQRLVPLTLHEEEEALAHPRSICRVVNQAIGQAVCIHVRSDYQTGIIEPEEHRVGRPRRLKVDGLAAVDVEPFRIAPDSGESGNRSSIVNTGCNASGRSSRAYCGETLGCDVIHIALISPVSGQIKPSRQVLVIHTQQLVHGTRDRRRVRIGHRSRKGAARMYKARVGAGRVYRESDRNTTVI